MSSAMSEIERMVRARAEELAPVAAEYEQLMRMIDLFDEERGDRSPPRSATGRSRGQARRGASTGGRRADEALALVAAHPGITVAALAEQLGAAPTYLYRVMPALEREGKVVKSGSGYILA